MILFSDFFSVDHNQQDELIWIIRIGKKEIIQGKRLELGKPLTKTANKRKMLTSSIKTGILWSIVFSHFFSEELKISRCMSAASEMEKN